MNEVAIVVPCYNEALRLDLSAFEGFSGSGHGVRFVFVDDGSRDGTHRLLLALRERASDRVDVLRRVENRGKAEAVRRGILYALDLAPDAVGCWDADLSAPLREIGTLCDTLESHGGAEMVFGSRVKLMGRDIVRSPWRHVYGRVFATAASVTLGLPIYDTQAGAKVFRNTPLLRGLFEEPFLSRWIFDVEIIARLIQQRRGSSLPQPGEVIYEQPLSVWRAKDGGVLNAADGVRAFIDLARIKRHYRL